MTNRKACVWIVWVLLVLCAGAERPAEVRREIQFPDLPGLRTLKCDLHMHTVFSDGSVWPTVRVDEAWREGLDAIALSDHIEYQPLKQDIPTNHNRPYELAVGAARVKNLLLIRGAEITRDTPPGHHNAIFLDDVNALDVKDFDEVFARAALQKAFIFWNHPGWQGPDRGRWGESQTRLLQAGRLHAIEICNGSTYYVDAHRMAVERNLPVVGDSDMHDPSPYADRTPENHRTMTLVFASERSISGIREALRAGRMVVWWQNRLLGAEPHLAALFDGCLAVRPAHRRASGNAWVEIANRCELDIELERAGDAGPPKILLPARRVSIVRVPASGDAGPVTLAYKALNFLLAPDKALEVQLRVPLRPAGPATTTAPAAAR